MCEGERDRGREIELRREKVPTWRAHLNLNKHKTTNVGVEQVIYFNFSCVGIDLSSNVPMVCCK